MAFVSKKTTILLPALAITVLTTLTACQSTQSYSPVFQRDNQSYETTGVGSTKTLAKQKALDSAKHTCGNKQPIILEDNMIYNGILSEQAGRVVEKVGAIIGVNADLSQKDDYEFTIKFQCR